LPEHQKHLSLLLFWPLFDREDLSGKF